MSSNAAEEETDATYTDVTYNDSKGTLCVSEAGIRFQSDDSKVGLILLRDELVNVSSTSFAVQNLFLLNVSTFTDEETYLSVFHMGAGVDLIRAKDKIEYLLNHRKRTSISCNDPRVVHKLAQHQDADFYGHAF